MQKLKKFLQKLNENLSKTQGFFQKLKLPELLGPVVFQSGVQKKACDSDVYQHTGEIRPFCKI